MTSWRERLRQLESHGLNAAGIADGTDWEAVLPGCRSVLVLGSGGPALWDDLVQAVRRDPQRLTGRDHPLDAHVAACLEAVDPEPPPSRLWVRCAADATPVVDFRRLAHQAGLGWSSRLGLLLHPVYGPWIGLRAACFTTQDLSCDPGLRGLPTGPKDVPGPCDSCPAPCATACPAGAVSALPEASFRIRACAQWRAPVQRGGHGGCPTRCDSRNACPEGASWRYSDLEQHYHDNRATGRRALAQVLELDDRRVGQGPRWADWMAD